MTTIFKKQKATITLIALCAEITLPFALYVALKGNSNLTVVLLFGIAVGLKLALVLAG